MSKVAQIEVVCIKGVYEEETGELWCPKGTLYLAYEDDGGRTYINNDGKHYIRTRYDVYSESFYKEHFLEIVSKVE